MTSAILAMMRYRRIAGMFALAILWVATATGPAAERAGRVLISMG